MISCNEDTNSTSSVSLKKKHPSKHEQPNLPKLSLPKHKRWWCTVCVQLWVPIVVKNVVESCG